MDLTKTVPRSPKEKMAGLVSLARTIDKARAYNAGLLGDYDYDCSQDTPLFEFLGTDGHEFARWVDELGSDEKISAWVLELLQNRTPEQIERFNQSRLQWHPEPGTPGYTKLVTMRRRLAPGRADIMTWFDIMDLDEGRPVAEPTRVLART